MKMAVGRYLGFHGNDYLFQRMKVGWASRIFIGRYHRSSTFLESLCGGSPSYGWRSVQAGKDLLKKGLRIRLGNGKDTNVLLDHWLPVLPPRAANGIIRDLDMRVEELCNQGRREWDLEKLNQILTPEDVALARSIKLSNYANEDVIIWPYTTNSKYSVKSGYWVATHNVEDHEKIIPPPGNLEVKKAIWKLHIPPKIQHFLWKAVAGAIPTAERLCSRTVSIDPICPRCCLQEETINHVLFDCVHANSVWRCSGFTQFGRGKHQNNDQNKGDEHFAGGEMIPSVLDKLDDMESTE
ncbi:unnamed protein product [Microthlaspi erraticum]|uniref:Reverse transcriptase zinc-binding domain-containing protein n=1 Tax=Microthlaspi erraticum TaxID=1685480 RepID=A0A6D2JQM3_9BRAS|nr:unnamed protein product [Microthlaspi erraticum]